MDLVKPLPVPTPTSEPFWQGLREERVTLQQCDACSHWVFYPRTRCDACLSESLTWKTVSGVGIVYTFTVARVPTAPHFEDETPQLLAVVELDVGARLTTTLVDVQPGAVTVGMAVRPVFDHVSDATTLLRFAPA